MDDSSAHSSLPAQTSRPFRVFISYTHEDAGHKAWVRRLAQDLVERGISVILDQWDLRFGQDVLVFMERSIRQADRVLLILTPHYCAKANDRSGGVGYESLVITGELAEQDTFKFVGVLRRGSLKQSVPSFLRSRLHVDMTDVSAYNTRVEELVHDLLDLPTNQRPTPEREESQDPSPAKVDEPSAQLPGLKRPDWSTLITLATAAAAVAAFAVARSAENSNVSNELRAPASQTGPDMIAPDAELPVPLPTESVAAGNAPNDGQTADVDQVVKPPPPRPTQHTYRCVYSLKGSGRGRSIITATRRSHALNKCEQVCIDDPKFKTHCQLDDT